ncbi:MAG TPA: outer membrane beta-barrel domain-containing protein [Steroidobacter sp.]|jgi:outer membrane beta-barrel protein|nr:outer membrane beta-barrel domain-containing protein [Steroidobacteraceae bacterium]HLS79793.1 outer membrane beta-barrel domain-containing protein [Steroidobacter sp.]
MEVSRVRVLLLIAASACALPGCATLERIGGGPVETPQPPAEPVGDRPIIEPEVERREIRRARIDTENFEVGAYAGVLSIEDFESNAVYGARLAYHVTEDFFLEASLGRSRAGRTSYENLSGSAELLTDSERDYTYYALSLGWNILPGEVFIGRNRAYNSAFYLIAGIGATSFAGDDMFTVSGGFGYRILPTDWLAVHFNVRDHVYDTDLLGEKKIVNNLEAHLGLSIFF